MAVSTRILFNHNLKRSICTTLGNCANYARREARFMKKMLIGDTGKRIWHKNRNRPTSGPIAAEKLTSSHVTRRMTVLNKIFMRHITDLMATGEASKKLLGRDIEISRVNLTPDFKKVRVYWSSKIQEKHNDTEDVLNECAFALRHELTQLRVIGQVPMILFVKDRQTACLDELDKRLRLADYGEDHEPTTQIYVPKHLLTLETKLSPEVKAQILKLEEEQASESEDENDGNAEDGTEYDVDLPPMRHDVLGVDHYAIMSRVKLALKKCQGMPKNHLDNVFTILPSEMKVSMGSSSFNSAREDREAFLSFLNARRREQRRMERFDKRERLLSHNLERENYKDHDDNEFFPEEEDFIEDEILELPK